MLLNNMDCERSYLKKDKLKKKLYQSDYLHFVIGFI